MKKYFQFSDTISGLNYFLRALFVSVLVLPGVFLLVYFIGTTAISSGLDMANPQAFEDDPMLIFDVFRETFSVANILMLAIAFLPALWFTLATLYKRVLALQVRFFPGRAREAFALIIIIDLFGLYFMGDPTIFWITGIIGFVIDMFFIFANSNIEDHKG